MTVEDICLCLSPVTLSRFCFRVFFEAVPRDRYIELDTNSPTATGGRGASRSDVDAPDPRPQGTCVCVDGHSFGPAGTLLCASVAVRSFSTNAALSSRTRLIICLSAGASCTTAGGIAAGGCAGSCALPRREAATALAQPAPPISRILMATFERCGKRPSIKHPLRLKRPVVFQTRV